LIELEVNLNFSCYANLNLYSYIWRIRKELYSQWSVCWCNGTVWAGTNKLLTMFLHKLWRGWVVIHLVQSYL